MGISIMYYVPSDKKYLKSNYTSSTWTKLCKICGGYDNRGELELDESYCNALEAAYTASEDKIFLEVKELIEKYGIIILESSY